MCALKYYVRLPLNSLSTPWYIWDPFKLVSTALLCDAGHSQANWSHALKDLFPKALYFYPQQNLQFKTCLIFGTLKQFKKILLKGLSEVEPLEYIKNLLITWEIINWFSYFTI